MAEEMLKQELLDISAQAIQKEYKGDFNFLKDAAQKLMSELRTLNLLSQNIQQHNTRLVARMSAIANYMHISDNNTQRILKMQHDFETAFHQYLGRTVMLAFVLKSGNIRFLNEVNIGDVYAKAVVQYQPGKAVGYISSSGLVPDINDLQKFSQQINSKIKIKQETAKPVFKEALRRYGLNNDEFHMKYEPSKDTFYWRQYGSDGHLTNILRGWSKQTQPNQMAEAYIDVVINEAKDVGGNLHMEDSLEGFNQHIEKQEIPAIVREDIIYNQNGDIQFAVKYLKFRTASFKQYAFLASNILAMQGTSISLEKFKQYLPGISSTKYEDLANDILQVIADRATDQVKERVKASLGSLYQEYHYTS